MHIFVTGASGWIGSATVPDLIAAGHSVSGLARSDEAAERVAAAGATVIRGSLEDLDVIRAAAAASDGVIHLGFIHDFANFGHSVEVDGKVVATLLDELEGSDRPLSIASGMLGMTPGHVITEQDSADVSMNPRLLVGKSVLDAAGRGVRSSVVRLAPSVHGAGDHGFIATLVGIARERGVSGYIGDGSNVWPGVHRDDAATLFRLAVEKAPAGSVLHGTDEQGTSIRAIAEVIGRHLELPVVSVDPGQAEEHFGWLGRFLAVNAPTSSAFTRELLGWTPTHPTLLADLEAGSYFEQ